MPPNLGMKQSLAADSGGVQEAVSGSPVDVKGRIALDTLSLVIDAALARL